MGSVPFAIVSVAILTLGLSLVVPAEDLPETAYDESESLLYINTSALSIAVPTAVTRAPAVRTRVPLLHLGFLRGLSAQGVHHGIGSPYPISDSLVILDHSFRC